MKRPTLTSLNVDLHENRARFSLKQMGVKMGEDNYPRVVPMWFLAMGSMSRDSRHAVILIGLGALGDMAAGGWLVTMNGCNENCLERNRQQVDHPIPVACNKQLGYQ